MIIIDLAEHALYVAVKQHDIRPPISKLTGLYPRNLLVLVMEMWETDPTLVILVLHNKSFLFVLIHLYYSDHP